MAGYKGFFPLWLKIHPLIPDQISLDLISTGSLVHNYSFSSSGYKKAREVSEVFLL